MLLNDFKGIELLDLEADDKLGLRKMGRCYFAVINMIISKEVKFTGSDGCLA